MKNLTPLLYFCIMGFAIFIISLLYEQCVNSNDIIYKVDTPVQNVYIPSNINILIKSTIVSIPIQEGNNTNIRNSNVCYDLYPNKVNIPNYIFTKSNIDPINDLNKQLYQIEHSNSYNSFEIRTSRNYYTNTTLITFNKFK